MCFPINGLLSDQYAFLYAESVSLSDELLVIDASHIFLQHEGAYDQDKIGVLLRAFVSFKALFSLLLHESLELQPLWILALPVHRLILVLFGTSIVTLASFDFLFCWRMVLPVLLCIWRSPPSGLIYSYLPLIVNLATLQPVSSVPQVFIASAGLPLPLRFSRNFGFISQKTCTSCNHSYSSSLLCS